MYKEAETLVSPSIVWVVVHTRGKRLSKLGSLLLVVDNESVQVARASDLELELVTVLLDLGSYRKQVTSSGLLAYGRSNVDHTYIEHPFCG